MLPALARMRRGAEYTAAVRRGRRASSRAVTVHVALDDGSAPARVGFVVSRAVGTAVVRNRLRRRLRHLMRERLGRLPAGAAVVVRAHPAAGSLPSAVLAAELDGALRRALGRSQPASVEGRR